MYDETVLDIDRMRWELCKDAESGEDYYQKTLHVDDETGMLIAYIRLPKDFSGSFQKHDTDYWIYVMFNLKLPGTLRSIMFLSYPFLTFSHIQQRLLQIRMEI